MIIVVIRVHSFHVPLLFGMSHSFGTTRVLTLISFIAMDETGRALFEYSRRGLLTEVQVELAEGESPNSYLAYDGGTALMVAARGGHAAVVRVLVDAKADLNVRSEDGSDALLHAASGGNVDVIKALLEAKADIETTNEDEVSPLILAAHYGHAAAAKTFLDAGANSQYRVPGWESVDCQKLLNSLVQTPSRPKASEHFAYESQRNERCDMMPIFHLFPHSRFESSSVSVDMM